MHKNCHTLLMSCYLTVNLTLSFNFIFLITRLLQWNTIYLRSFVSIKIIIEYNIYIPSWLRMTICTYCSTARTEDTLIIGPHVVAFHTYTDSWPLQRVLGEVTFLMLPTRIQSVLAHLDRFLRVCSLGYWNWGCGSFFWNFHPNV